MATYNGHNEDSSGNILLSIGNGMTATVETGTTASQAYTKGSYLFFNNRLCKATTAIASGATLAIGTNLSQTSIGQEITSHLRSSDAKEFYFDVKDGKYGYYPSASKVASEFVPFGGTTLLWQNSSTSSAFNAQTVSLSLSKYGGIIIVSAHNGGSGQDTVSYYPIGVSNYFWIGVIGLNGGNFDYGRYISVTTSGVSFGDSCYANGTPSSVYNGIPIPKYIYGISAITI